jgi:hypothetical protein
MNMAQEVEGIMIKRLHNSWVHVIFVLIFILVGCNATEEIVFVGNVEAVVKEEIEIGEVSEEEVDLVITEGVQDEDKIEEVEQLEDIEEELPTHYFQEGEWSSEFGTLVISKVSNETLEFDLFVSSGGHVGEINGVARIDNDTAKYVNDEYADWYDGESCVLTFTAKGDAIHVEQTFGCLAFHGMAVSFEGVYEKGSDIQREEPGDIDETELVEAESSTEADFLVDASSGVMTGCEYSLQSGVTGSDIIAAKGTPEWEGFYDGGYGIKYGPCIYFVPSELEQEIGAIEMAGDALHMAPAQVRETFGPSAYEGDDEYSGGYLMVYYTGDYTLFLLFESSESIVESLRLK